MATRLVIIAQDIAQAARAAKVRGVVYSLLRSDAADEVLGAAISLVQQPVPK